VWWPEPWGFPISARTNMVPMITASPNPVPAGEGVGMTNITWNTGDDTIGYVYVSVNDAEESLFARFSQGSRAANWIQTGLRYRFRLYDGTGRGKLLAETTVTRNEPGS
jgi:hypothetical protein